MRVWFEVVKEGDDDMAAAYSLGVEHGRLLAELDRRRGETEAAGSKPAERHLRLVD